MTMSSTNVISLASRKRKEEDKDEGQVDFDKIQKENALKAEKAAKDRQQHNKKVKSEYRLVAKTKK